MDENQRFIDAEYCIDKYFDEHITPRLDFYIAARNAAVVGGTSTGFGVRNMVAPSKGYASDVTLNFPANDIEKVCSDMRSDKSLSQDLMVLQSAWGQAVEDKIGKEKYNALSRQLGCDLAEAYVGYRLEKRMIDYEVEKNSYSGSLDYMFDEARRSSIMNRCPTPALQQYIDKKVIEKYNPSLLEKGAGKTLGVLSDTIITAPVCGVSSWSSFARNMGFDLAVQVGKEVSETEASRQHERDNDVSRIMSKAIFGSNHDVFASFRSASSSVNPYSSDVVQNANHSLSQKIARSSGSGKGFPLSGGLSSGFGKKTPDVGVNSTGIDLQMSHLNQQAEMSFAVREKFGDGAHASQPVDSSVPVEGSAKSVSGWGGLLDQFGLGDFGKVGKNLGYVLAMLPDMLIGMFTGKSRNLKFGDNLLPIGSIIAGMFVKNPILKLLLIGLGGANLLNKAGHEALDHRDSRQQPVRQYRQYPNEVLDSRVQQPVMKGNTLIVSIDNIPMVITVNDEAVDAYEKGMLPLNTLANAVLRRYDEHKESVSENYEQSVSQEHVVERSRGLK